MEEQNSLDFLSKLPFFSNLSKNMTSKINKVTHQVKTSKNQEILREGVSNQEIYIVKEGEFRGFVHYK